MGSAADTLRYLQRLALEFGGDGKRPNMLASLVGAVDFNAALVLIAMCAAVGIPTSIMIAKRRSKLEVTQEFELAKIKQKDDRDLRLYNSETERTKSIKALEQNLITSHRAEQG